VAKLNKKAAEGVNNASSGFDPIPDGAYHFILKDVDADREGPKGPYWSWEYECVEEGTFTTGEGKEQKLAGRRQWNNTSLAQEWSLKQTFDAFGVAPDTDTDELVGHVVKLVLEVTTIQAGKRKGELSNNVVRVTAPDEDIKAAIDKKRSDAAEMAEIF
jgi:hypothetical protein